jgi:hypothetical protein
LDSRKRVRVLEKVRYGNQCVGGQGSVGWDLMIRARRPLDEKKLFLVKLCPICVSFPFDFILNGWAFLEVFVPGGGASKSGALCIRASGMGSSTVPVKRRINEYRWAEI